jgi:hypothetical protein
MDLVKPLKIGLIMAISAFALMLTAAITVITSQCAYSMRISNTLTSGLMKDFTTARWEEWGIPDFIMAFPPCTDLANSGSRHWAKKRLENPSFQDEAADTCRIAADIADYFGVPYMIENPVGKLSTLWRKPDYTFHPCDYAGYLPEDDKHPDFPDIIPARDRYFKKTCLWTGNGFVIPPRALILPKEEDKDNPGWAKTGGKSSRTKMIRSLTPRGFARAVFESNSK